MSRFARLRFLCFFVLLSMLPLVVVVVAVVVVGMVVVVAAMVAVVAAAMAVVVAVAEVFSMRNGDDDIAARAARSCKFRLISGPGW